VIDILLYLMVGIYGAILIGTVILLGAYWLGQGRLAGPGVRVRRLMARYLRDRRPRAETDAPAVAADRPAALPVR